MLVIVFMKAMSQIKVLASNRIEIESTGGLISKITRLFISQNFFKQREPKIFPRFLIAKCSI